MKTDYRFWEQNLNPITMQDVRNTISSCLDIEEMG